MAQGITNSVNIIQQGGSGDGDLVYAVNLTSGEPVESDKVILNLQPTYDTHKTTLMDPGTYQGTVFILHNNDVNYTRNYSGISYLRRWINGELVNIRNIPVLGRTGLHDIIFIVDDDICYASQSLIYRYNMRTGLTSSWAYYAFTDDLKYHKNNGIIYNNDDTESYTITNGSFSGGDIVINYHNNCLAVCSSTKTVLADCTNFPECTSRTITTSYTRIVGTTGGSIGDYVIGAKSGLISFDKITESGLVTDFIIDTPTLYSSNQFAQYSNTEKVFTTVNQNNQIIIYTFDSDSKTWSQANVPAEVQQQFDEDVALGGKDRGFQISTNSRLEVFGWCIGRSQYDWRTRVMQLSNGTAPYLMDNEKVNYDSITTVTAFATGNIDEEGRYEVKTVLPNKLTATISITPDPDSIVVRGDI